MKRYTPFEFIKEATAIHGNKYDYSKIKYVYSDEKLHIICKKHNFEFLKKPNLHLKGSGCPICSGYKKITNDIFVNLGQKLYKNKDSYEKINLINNHQKVIITCKIHSHFERTPDEYLEGKGCDKCAKKVKYTTAEFIKKSKLIHGEKYLYDRTNYINNKTKVTITCPVHGHFNQFPSNHFRIKVGCDKCAGNSKSTSEEFIRKSKLIHGKRFKYDNVNYIDRNTEVMITCPVHGDFLQKPSNHLSGKGCNECGGKIKLTKQIFIEKSKLIHGERFKYDNVNYINRRTTVMITCSVHGDFPQTPNSHLSGAGCSKCSGKIKKTTKEFIEKSKLIHGNKYSYRNVNYIDSKTLVIITCCHHGDFPQIPSSHLSGKGCNKCGGKIKLTTEKFIKKAKLIHGDKYSYDNVNYIDRNTEVMITCPYHGDYLQAPDNHLSGSGCKKCKYSKGEAAIETVLKKLNIEFNSQHTFEDCVYKRRLFFDFAISVNGQVGLIEFHGEQHYNKISFFEKNKQNAEARIRDEIKLNYAKTKNIMLLIIPFTQIDNVEQLIKEFVSRDF